MVVAVVVVVILVPPPPVDVHIARRRVHPSVYAIGPLRAAEDVQYHGVLNGAREIRNTRVREVVGLLAAAAEGTF